MGMRRQPTEARAGDVGSQRVMENGLLNERVATLAGLLLIVLELGTEGPLRDAPRN